MFFSFIKFISFLMDIIFQDTGKVISLKIKSLRLKICYPFLNFTLFHDTTGTPLATSGGYKVFDWGAKNCFSSSVGSKCVYIGGLQKQGANFPARATAP